MLPQDLYNLLGSFDKKELRSFRGFLHSPYFNKHTKVINLFEGIIKHYPDFTGKGLSKEELYCKLYKSKYNDSTIRSLLFRLMKLAENFIVNENFKNSLLSQSVRFMYELNKRSQHELLEFNLKHIQKTFDNYENNAFDNLYYNKYDFAVNVYNNLALKGSTKNKKEEKNLLMFLDKAAINLMFMVVTELSSLYLNSQNFIRNHNGLERFSCISELVKCIDFKSLYLLTKGKSPDDYILEIYDLMLGAFLNIGDWNSYLKYRNAVNANINKLSRDEISFHYSKLIANCIISNNKGKPINEGKTVDNYSNELFILYNEFLENEYFIDNKNKYIPVSLFRAILFSGIRQHDLKWLKRFTGKYSKFLPPGFRTSMHEYGLANYYFEAGEFDKALKHANSCSGVYFRIKFDLKIIKLKIYYEINDSENVLRYIHNLKESIRTDEQVNQKIKEFHTLFIRYLEKLVLFNEGRKKNDIEYYHKKLAKEPDGMLVTWLKNKYAAALKL